MFKNIINPIKVHEEGFTKIYSLFGIIPIFKCKDFDSHYIFRILGFRFSIRHKTNFNCLEVKSSGVNENKRTPQLIVSLTSHPPRINTTAIAISTLLQQTVKPDRLILWLADSQFPSKENDLPEDLLKLTEYGLEIRWCKDLGSYKKIVPALKEFPEDIIVTADDDIYYQNNWLESLYSAYLKDNKNIYVKRAVRMIPVNNEFRADSKELQQVLDEMPPSFANQLMGGSGCLFPPHSLCDDIFNEENFLSLIPTHDDIYIWTMAILKGTKIKVVDGYKAKMETIDRTCESALSKMNGKGNFGLTPDEAFKRMAKKYPEIIKMINDEINKKQIKLSVITICYNDENIERTCESIVNQSWQDFEWIVIDGGSRKEIIDIINKYKDRIDKFISEKDNGVYNAYNKGLNLACGKYVNFLNSGDNYRDKDVLKTIFENKYYKDDILYGDMMAIDISSSKKEELYPSPKQISDKFFITSNIFTPCTFAKKELFDKFGQFDEQYKIVSDFDRWIVFQKNGATFKYVPCTVADFYMDGLSTSKKFKATHVEERKIVYKKYFTKKEVREEIYNVKIRNLKFRQKIFSILNSPDYENKIIMILGIPIFIKGETTK